MSSRVYSLLLLFFVVAHGACEEETWYAENSSNGTEHSKVLSRKRRFLIFPEGSSLQLVFCLTYPSVNVIGDIILWGNTAALAWELPQDPYSPYMHHADPLHRRQDNTKKVYYTDEKGKLLFTVPYKRKAIVNPAFAKRSVDTPPPVDSWTPTSGVGDAPSSDNSRPAPTCVNPRPEIESQRRRMHANAARPFLSAEHLTSDGVEFHRLSRKGLLEKLEIFLRALGMNGRECVLRMLCEVGQSANAEQGSFVEEITRAVFTLPAGAPFTQPQHRAYDAAHNEPRSCRVAYPECEPDQPDIIKYGNKKV